MDIPVTAVLSHIPSTLTIWITVKLATSILGEARVASADATHNQPGKATPMTTDKAFQIAALNDLAARQWASQVASFKHPVRRHRLSGLRRETATSPCRKTIGAPARKMEHRRG
jgi:hypothetical protein